MHTARDTGRARADNPAIPSRRPVWRPAWRALAFCALVLIGLIVCAVTLGWAP